MIYTREQLVEAIGEEAVSKIEYNLEHPDESVVSRKERNVEKR